MKVTVILCTYNRCDLLPKALTSAVNLESSPSSDLEILVVDNNSTDQTRQIVDTFCQRYPGRFRYIFEPRQGKSYALNTGIKESHGEVLAFMDDDVVVDREWIVRLTANLHSGSWAGAGGRILPIWTSAPPGWLSLNGRYASAPFALFDLGNEPGQLSEPPFGTNMAFRKSVFEKYGGFRVDLGPRVGSFIRNEDTEFGRRVLEAGELLRYEPSAVVYHPVTAERLNKDYLLSWWFDKGRADVREFGVVPGTTSCAGVPLHLWRRLAASIVRWNIALDAPARFQRKLKVWGLAGTIAECHTVWRNAGGPAPCPHN
jgi:glycosyltransferase involved in cell wall biosynthesis